MSPVQIGNATLYLGDCLEILPTLGKVDAVVTDPPYGFGRYETDKAVDVQGLLDFMEAKSAVVFGYPELLAYWLSGPFSEWVTWWPSNGSLKGRGGYVGRESEAIAFIGEVLPCSEKIQRRWLDEQNNSPAFSQKYSELSTKRFPDVWTDPAPGLGFNSKNRQHPNEKPLSIILRAAGMLPAQTILDPFMGSGTTGVACANLGRKFIGVEIEEKYFDIACQRIEAAYAQGRLFEDPEPQPEVRKLIA